MASALRRRPDNAAPRFFIDRGLGRRFVPPVLEEAGFEVVLMSDLYPNGEDQLVGDDRWIEDVSALGMVALTKDAAITRAHSVALSRSTLRVFALPNANLTGAEMSERFRVNRHRIVQRSRQAGPYVDVVMPSSLSRRWPR